MELVLRLLLPRIACNLASSIHTAVSLMDLLSLLQALIAARGPLPTACPQCNGVASSTLHTRASAESLSLAASCATLQHRKIHTSQCNKSTTDLALTGDLDLLPVINGLKISNSVFNRLPAPIHLLGSHPAQHDRASPNHMITMKTDHFSTR